MIFGITGSEELPMMMIIMMVEDNVAFNIFFHYCSVLIALRGSRGLSH